MKSLIKILLILFIYCSFAYPQVKKVNFNLQNGIEVVSVNENQKLKKAYPLLSIEINEITETSLNSSPAENDSGFQFKFKSGLTAYLKIEKEFSPGWKARLTFINESDSNIKIQNLVPLSKSEDHIYISSSAPWNLASSKIFRPGLGSVGVVLPDNAWALGYSAVEMENGKFLAALARRMGGENTEFRRYSALIKPGGKVFYNIFIDNYEGEWQNGLKMFFRGRFLYDLTEFDNRLFERGDLNWIKKDYLMVLQMPWDHQYYERFKSRYRFEEFLDEGDKYFNGYDVFGIWPTWPTLGVDQRNQWDLYRDLPGGMSKLKELVQYARGRGTRTFVAYNPWDQSTRYQDPYEGMAELIKDTDADGVVLDTQGSSSERLQNAADSVKPGVIMYSEGMAVPKDMPGIVSGRVHNAIHMPPPLNLNKYIKPDFSIFRVVTFIEGRIHREIGVSFFNGIGTEINMFHSGRPSWIQEEYLYLGRTTKLLRENSSAFNDLNWKPLINTLRDSIWVNRFSDDDKTIYTIFSLLPEGYNAALFEAELKDGYHYLDLWNHENVSVDTINGNLYVRAEVEGFNKSALGTREEGNIGCIANFRTQLIWKIKEDNLSFSSAEGDSIVLWAGNPSYQNGLRRTFNANSHNVNLTELFGRYEGKYVLQLFSDGELDDECVFELTLAQPKLISRIIPTEKTDSAPKGMVDIPAGTFDYRVIIESDFIPYPVYPDTLIEMQRFFIDKYPVTNKEFKKFLDESGYIPEDTVNFLKHWSNGTYKAGEENFPVVYVSLEDARAFAKWNGKRLLTEAEWQYAAQGKDTVSYPWGSEFDSSKTNFAAGKAVPVNSFPGGASAFGVEDLVGNVWQLTNDVYDNGSYYFVMMRGGSFYNPTSSWWYVKGGPREINKSQMLLLVSPGFERNATVGFRCVKDAKQ